MSLIPSAPFKAHLSHGELEETAFWLELLVDGKMVSSEKLSAVRQECDELIAIFVTILKRSKEIS